MDGEAAGAGGDRGKADLRRKTAGVAEHDVAVARIVACVARAVALHSPDDEVVEAVAVDVAGRRYRIAGLVVRVLAMDDEAAVAGRDRGEVDLRRKARGFAEHHVAVARKVAGVAGAIAKVCPDDEVVEAVAVDVTRRGHPTGAIAGILAMNDEAAGPGGHIRGHDRHGLCSASLARVRARSLLAGEVPSAVGDSNYATPVRTSSQKPPLRVRWGSAARSGFVRVGSPSNIASVYEARGFAGEYVSSASAVGFQAGDAKFCCFESAGRSARD